MSQKLCAKNHKLRLTVLQLGLLGAIVLAAVAFGNTGCEDMAIGRPCDVLTEATDEQGVYNAEALECPSRICLKPVVATSAQMPEPPTGPFCSASCSQDSDCDGQLRDTGNVNDRRCKQGFACGIAFVKGKICCQKLCLCKDFIGTLSTPPACQGAGAATCQQLSQ